MRGQRESTSAWILNRRPLWPSGAEGAGEDGLKLYMGLVGAGYEESPYYMECGLPLYEGYE